jgi:dUTPase
MLLNLYNTPIKLHRNERIAQFIVLKYADFPLHFRGMQLAQPKKARTGGFGSTSDKEETKV